MRASCGAPHWAAAFAAALLSTCVTGCSTVGPGLANHPIDCAMGITWADCQPGTLGYDRKQGRMEQALSRYVGRPVSEYILDRGPPTSTFEIGPGKKGFQWRIAGQTVGAVVPVSGMLVAVPPKEETCMVSLIASARKPFPAMSDWIVESWRWNGAC
jgi:hypothetical protein